MIQINGRFTEAKIYSNTALQSVIDQIKELTNQAFMAGTKVRIMPDYHAGMLNFICQNLHTQEADTL